jgi:hypothetical protein
MSYRIKITEPDGDSHVRKETYKTKKGAERKAEYWRKLLAPEIKVVQSKGAKKR